MAWILQATAIILLLYIASLMNLLSFFGLILPRIGVILGVYFIIDNWRRRHFVFTKISLVTSSFLGYFILLAGTLYHSRLLHYDNFSHWALIVKYLLTQQALPDMHSHIIGFSSYPIGTSLWCYYFVNFVGFNEGVMLVAQFCLIMPCLYAMVAVIKDKSNLLTVSVMFLVIVLFNYFNIAIRMNNLLVDFVLPLLTLAAIAGIVNYQKNIYMMSATTIIVTSVLGIVKNNGTFFVVIVLCYYVLMVIKNKTGQLSFAKKSLFVIGTVGLTMTPYILWLWHIKNAFGQQLSKHEVSVTAYQNIYEAKTPAVINRVMQSFLSHVFSPATVPTQGIIVINLLFIITIIIINMIRHQKKHLIIGLIMTNLIIVGYYLGILMMFIFSMPNEEALALAGFDRYAGSIIIFGLGSYSFFAVDAIDSAFYEQRFHLRNYQSFKSIRTKYLYQYSSIAMMFASTLLILSENNGMQYNLRQYQSSVPYKVEHIVGNQMTLNHQNYLIISADKTQVDNYFTQYVGKYYLYSDHVDAREDISQLSRTQFIDLIGKYDAVVVIDKHYTFRVMGHQYLNKNIKQGIYSSKYLLSNVVSEHEAK